MAARNDFAALVYFLFCRAFSAMDTASLASLPMPSKSPSRIRLAGVNQLPPQARTAGIAEEIGEIGRGETPPVGMKAHRCGTRLDSALIAGMPPATEAGKNLTVSRPRLCARCNSVAVADAGVDRRSGGAGQRQQQPSSRPGETMKTSSRVQAPLRPGLPTTPCPRPAVASGTSRATPARQSTRGIGAEQHFDDRVIPPAARARAVRTAVSASSAWTSAISGALLGAKLSISFFMLNQSPFPSQSFCA